MDNYPWYIWTVILKEKYTQLQFHLTIKDEGLNNMNTNTEKEFLKSVIYNRKSHVYIWYFVASWACEVTVILIQEASSSLL